MQFQEEKEKYLKLSVEKNELIKTNHEMQKQIDELK
jgi:hypothetical protein